MWPYQPESNKLRVFSEPYKNHTIFFMFPFASIHMQANQAVATSGRNIANWIG